MHTILSMKPLADYREPITFFWGFSTVTAPWNICQETSIYGIHGSWGNFTHPPTSILLLLFVYFPISSLKLVKFYYSNKIKIIDSLVTSASRIFVLCYKRDYLLARFRPVFLCKSRKRLTWKYWILKLSRASMLIYVVVA